MAEAKRIQDEGQKHIGQMLDEELIEAAQTLRALEDGDEEDFYHIEASVPEPADEYEENRPAAKRIKGANGNAEVVVGGGNGLLKEDALENVRFYAEMRRKQAEEEKRLKERKTPASGMALLGGYGSGDESD